jgi:hypothetical protein
MQFNCTVPKLVACAIRLGGNSSNSPQNGMKKKSGQKKATGFLVIFSLIKLTTSFPGKTPNPEGGHNPFHLYFRPIPDLSDHSIRSHHMFPDIDFVARRFLSYHFNNA